MEQTVLSINHKILVRHHDHSEFVDVSEIEYLESEGNYVVLHFISGRKKIMYLATLGAAMAKLDPYFFFRADRKFIINLMHIQKLWHQQGKRMFAIMSSGKKIDISRRRTLEMRRKFSFILQPEDAEENFEEDQEPFSTDD